MDSSLSAKSYAKELLESIETGATHPVKYINPNKYIQHNLAVANGLEGFGEVLSALPKGTAKVKVQRVFQDGNYVFAHTEYNFFGPKIGFDIFRFEDGLIVEHWDNLQELSPKTASGRSQIDGAVEIIDLDKTEENKKLVSQLINDVFLGNAPNKISDYISSEFYAQHNPHVADGLNALGAGLAAMAQAGTPMIYIRNHLILGEGNFVLTVSEGLFLGKHVSFYDLFRIENAKIVEHWDTIEEIPLRQSWKNSNGKFNFVTDKIDSPIQVIGKSWVADFSEHKYKLDFHSETSMTWTTLKENGANSDTSMTVVTNRVELRPNLYMVTWGEPSLGANVVHIQDYENSQVWTNIVINKTNQFIQMTGKLLPYYANIEVSA